MIGRSTIAMAGGLLAEVVPPRRLEEGERAARDFFATLAGGEVLGLQVVITAAGPRFLLRAGSEGALERALSQLGAAYPQVGVERLDAAGRPDLDPARCGPAEEAASLSLAPRGDAALPLLRNGRGEESPLAVALAAAPLRCGERVLMELEIASAPARAAARLRARARPRVAPAREESPGSVADAARLVIPLAAVAGGLRLYLWYQAGEILPLVLSGAGMLGGGVLLALAVRALSARSAPLAPALAERKLAGPLFRASLRVTAIGPSGSGRARLPALARQVAEALSALDDPAGGGLRPGARSRRLLLSAEEAAALWHLPTAGEGADGARRMRARRLPPPPGHALRGTRVGTATAGGPGEEGPGGVFLPAPLLHRNQLVVAKTRRGKSTLLAHLARGVMERALDEERAASLVVVDPHRDLAEAVLDSVPPQLAGDTVYLDMAHRERPVGLNLLDVGLFPDRDLATEHVVTVMSRIWPESWGPRMEGALRSSVATLMELNRALPRDCQHTLLDVAPLLADVEYREAILEQLDDAVLQSWWKNNFNRLNKTLQQQVATPVTNKIGRFVVAESSRLLLGQARSTIDPRVALRERSVLVINTASGALGEGASALIGATWLNLLGLMVEEQAVLPPEERRRVVVLVDESSTLAAVDYRRMLSELVKYGASFVLVTQGLAMLDAVDRQLAPSILSNIDGLTVFQVSAEDARRLAPELGGALDVEDLTGLDDYECYARWWDGRTRPRAFSFRVDPPPRGRAAARSQVAERSAARFGRAREEVAAEIARALGAPGRAVRRALPPPVTVAPEGVDPLGPGDGGAEVDGEGPAPAPWERGG
ncbi:MAG: type IV secretory system conjugative DNA transfer family protein [Chloroflexi bacterium]|nr:type IV secretory system conjugative DNA transfer family protein [Chloroflexota bacterium]